MKVALVLGSGSAKGYAHIGVIEELKARGHEIAAISGTSMGAVIGGLEAAGGLEDFARWARSLRQFDVLRNLDFALGRGGVVKAKRIVERLDEFCGGARIEDLPIPYTAVATDITSRREIWFQHGPLVQAMRASMSMPGFITPVMLGDRMLVDGAVLNPVPVEPTFSVPADVTIAVSLHGRSDLLGVQMLADAGDVEPARVEADGGEEESEALGRRLAARVAGLFGRSGDAEGDEAREPEEERDLRARLSRLETLLDADGGDDERENGGGVGAARSVPPAQPAGDGAGEAERPAGERGSAADLLVHAARSISMSEVMEMTLATMEDTLERVRDAVSPAHLRIEVPGNVCGALEFHRAAEVIEVGRAIAVEAFDRAGL